MYLLVSLRCVYIAINTQARTKHMYAHTLCSHTQTPFLCAGGSFPRGRWVSLSCYSAKRCVYVCAYVCVFVCVCLCVCVCLHETAAHPSCLFVCVHCKKNVCVLLRLRGSPYFAAFASVIFQLPSQLVPPPVCHVYLYRCVRLSVCVIVHHLLCVMYIPLCASLSVCHRAPPPVCHVYTVVCLSLCVSSCTTSCLSRIPIPLCASLSVCHLVPPPVCHVYTVVCVFLCVILYRLLCFKFPC